MIDNAIIQKITEEIENLLYPELRPYRRNDRTRLLRKASETPLDFIEWAGILAALVLVASLTRYGVADFGLADRIAVGLVNFLAAIFLLGVTAGRFWCGERDADCAHNYTKHANSGRTVGGFGLP